LKLYVCTKEDVINGRCDTCKYSSCYYKECGNVCSDWLRSNNETYIKNNKCFHYEQQTCTNKFFDSIINTTTRFREFICPTLPPTTTLTTIKTTTTTTTTTATTTMPTAKPIATNKPTTTITSTRDGSFTPLVEAQTGKYDSDGRDNIIYGLGAAAFFCLIIGIFAGAYGFKKIHDKDCLNIKMRPNKVQGITKQQESRLAFVNGGFQTTSVSEGGFPDVFSNDIPLSDTPVK